MVGHRPFPLPRAALAVLFTLALVASVASFAGPVGQAAAADYSFSVAEERVNVTVLQDGSVDIDYLIHFTDVGYLDGVDIGMPNSLYDLSTATAKVIVDGAEQGTRTPYTSPWIDIGVAVDLLPSTISAIQGGGSFTLLFHINNPHMIYSNPNQEGQAGVKFTPTWFDPEYQNGNTGILNASVILPESLTDPSEVVWLTNQPFDGLYMDSEIGRMVATWEAVDVDPASQSIGAYDIGAGFPASQVAVYYDPSTNPDLNTGGGDLFEDLGVLFVLLFPIMFVAMFISIFVAALRGASKRRMDYFEPKLSVVGAGPRRDLTAVEAAVVLERPLENVATMILFGLLRKKMVRVVDESYPMQLQKLTEVG